MKEILTALFLRKEYVITFFLFVVIGSMTLAYVLPAEYEATGMVIITTGREKKPFIPSEKDSRTSFMQVSMEDVGSEVEILLSHPVLARVVDENGLDRANVPSTEQLGKFIVYHLKKGLKDFLVAIGLKPEIPPREDAIARLGEKVEVEYVKRTNIITISYRNSVPVVASKVVNSLIDHYINHHIDVFGYSHALKAITLAKQESHERLTEMEKTINDYVASRSISNLESERAQLLEKLAEAENRARLLSGIKKGKFGMEMGVTEIGNVIEDPALLELSSRLTNSELKRIELLSRFGAGDIKVTVIEKEIGEIKKLIRRMLETSLDTWQSIMESYQDRLRELDLAKTEIDPMRRELANRTQEYLLNVEKYNEIVISVNLDQAKLSSIKVVQFAEVPEAPAFPKKIIILIVSLFFGVTGGASLAFAINKFSGRIISTSELQALGPEPVLASIREFSPSEMKSPETVTDGLDNEFVQLSKMLISEEKSSYAVMLASLSAGSGVSFVARRLNSVIAERADSKIVTVVFHCRSEDLAAEHSFDRIVAEPGSALKIVRSESDHDVLDVNISVDGMVVKSRLVEAFCDTLKEKYRYVFFEMPAQRDSMFYLNLVQQMDRIFLILAYDDANRYQLNFMKNLIAQHKGQISGYIFNRRKNPIPAFIYNRFF